MFRIIYWICATLALLLLLFDGAVGQVLTTTPDRGKVTRDPAGPTLRGVGLYVWASGGYQGGK